LDPAVLGLFTQKVGEAEAIFSNVFHRLKAKKTIRMEYRMEFPSLWFFFSNSLKKQQDFECHPLH